MKKTYLLFIVMFDNVYVRITMFSNNHSIIIVFVKANINVNYKYCTLYMWKTKNYLNDSKVSKFSTIFKVFLHALHLLNMYLICLYDNK